MFKGLCRRDWRWACSEGGIVLLQLVGRALWGFYGAVGIGIEAIVSVILKYNRLLYGWHCTDGINKEGVGRGTLSY